VAGFVCNLPDGGVQVVAEGSPHEIDDFLREVRDRFLTNIRDERCDVQSPTGEFGGFEIRH
jgi:acylphosphatase